MANTVFSSNITTAANIAIPFPFLDSSHVKVYLDDTLKTLGTDYSINSSNELVWIIIPSGPGTVLMRRETPSTPVVDWSLASTVDSDGLDSTAKQAIYLLQDTEEKPGNQVEISTLNSAVANSSNQIESSSASWKAGKWAATVPNFRDYESIKIIYSFIVDGGTETAAAGGYQYGCQVALRLDVSPVDGSISPHYGSYALGTNEFLIAGDHPTHPTTSPWFAGKGSSPTTNAGSIWGSVTITGWRESMIRVTADSHWINAGAGTAVGGVGRYEPVYFATGSANAGSPTFTTSSSDMVVRMLTSQVSDGTQTNSASASLSDPGYITGSTGKMTVLGIF